MTFWRSRAESLTYVLPRVTINLLIWNWSGCGAEIGSLLHICFIENPFLISGVSVSTVTSPPTKCGESAGVKTEWLAFAPAVSGLVFTNTAFLENCVDILGLTTKILAPGRNEHADNLSSSGLVNPVRDRVLLGSGCISKTGRWVFFGRG